MEVIGFVSMLIEAGLRFHFIADVAIVEVESLSPTRYTIATVA